MTVPGPGPTHPATGSRGPRAATIWLSVTVGVLAVALVASVVYGINKRNEVGDLEAAVANLEQRVEELEAEVAEANASDPLLGPLEDLLGSSDLGPLLGLLEDLAAGGGLDSGSLGDLFGDGSGDTGALGDLFGEGGLEGLLGEGGLEGLLGEGGLEGLLGEGGLEGLLGGGGLDGLLGDGGLEGAALTECFGGSQGFGNLLGSSDPLTGTTSQQLEQIASRVETLRELNFVTNVNPTFLAPDQFAQRVADEVRDEYPADQAALDSRYLGALGAIPKGTDLLELQADLLAGQVAGFYDPDAGELVVPDDGDGEFDAFDQIVLAHELDHALTDQVLGLPDPAVKGDTDGNLARIALVEGDATALMQQYSLAHISLLDQFGQLLDPQTAASQQQLEASSPYLQKELMFAYLTGLNYACGLYAEGSWAAVDAAYQNPPETSAEILFPDRIGVAAVDPADPGLLGADWEIARTDTLGAAQLLWLFEAPGGDEAMAIADARELVREWRGGETVLATRGADTAVGLSLVGGSGGEALCRGIDDWYDASFDDDTRSVTGDLVTFAGGEQSAALRCAGDNVRLGIAPTVAEAESLAR